MQWTVTETLQRNNKVGQPLWTSLRFTHFLIGNFRITSLGSDKFAALMVCLLWHESDPPQIKSDSCPAWLVLSQSQLFILCGADLKQRQRTLAGSEAEWGSCRYCYSNKHHFILFSSTSNFMHPWTHIKIFIACMLLKHLTSCITNDLLKWNKCHRIICECWHNFQSHNSLFCFKLKLMTSWTTEEQFTSLYKRR